MGVPISVSLKRMYSPSPKRNENYPSCVERGGEVFPKGTFTVPGLRMEMRKQPIYFRWVLGLNLYREQNNNVYDNVDKSGVI